MLPGDQGEVQLGGPRLVGMGTSVGSSDAPSPRRALPPSLLGGLSFQRQPGSLFLPLADTDRAAIWCGGLRQLGASAGRRGCAFGREK